MDDRKLDNYISRGKDQANRFFSHEDYSLSREAVYARIDKGRKPKPLWSFALKIVVVSACLLCLVGITLVATYGSVNTDSKQPAAVASQTVSLGNADKDCLINYFPVSAPDYEESSLVSVLWELGESSKMMYSTIFERCDKPYPATAVDFPGTGDTIILILSGDSAKDFINYRLLGCGSDTVKVWREEDFITGGSIEMTDGLIVERRVAQETDGAVVSHIVPYQILVTGELMLPVRELNVRVGDQILLVGSDSEKPLTVSFENGLFEIVDQQKDDTAIELTYQATDAGNDVMLLKGQGAGSGYMNLHVME